MVVIEQMYSITKRRPISRWRIREEFGSKVYHTSRTYTAAVKWLRKQHKR